MALTVTVLSCMCLMWVGLVQSMPRYNSLMSYHSLQEPKEQQDYSAEWQGNAFFSGGYHPRVRTNRQPMNRQFSTGMDQFMDQAPRYTQKYQKKQILITHSLLLLPAPYWRSLE